MKRTKIRIKKWKVIRKQFGIATMLKLMRILEPTKGKGDYTKERQTWLESFSIDDLRKQIKAIRKKRKRKAT